MLQSQTHPAWLDVALGRLDLTLIDHAHCEKKAAASAMSLVAAYPEHAFLVRRMVKLAREELRHFEQVHEHIVARGLVMTRDPGDTYARELFKHMRSHKELRLTDRLLAGALIEERSRERLEMLAQGLAALPDEAELSQFYARLAISEAGHATLFVRLAEKVAGAEAVHERLTELAGLEAEIVGKLPLEPRIH
jgi:tRNA 2-(methylsulfanyl)-N6-isopentenyladenosine37 hydroxylase